jgi:hypothetical protein
VAFSVRCGPPQPFKSLIHKGLPTRGRPFVLHFGCWTIGHTVAAAKVLIYSRAPLPSAHLFSVGIVPSVFYRLEKPCT